jgi:hypothetical protein
MLESGILLQIRWLADKMIHLSGTTKMLKKNKFQLETLCTIGLIIRDQRVQELQPNGSPPPPPPSQQLITILSILNLVTN